VFAGLALNACEFNFGLTASKFPGLLGTMRHDSGFVAQIHVHAGSLLYCKVFSLSLSKQPP